MKNYARFPCATFLFSCLSAQALSTEAPAWVKPSAATIQGRIKRVEGGLCTPVVVKGAPDQKKKLIDRMAFYQIPAVSIALINELRQSAKICGGWGDSSALTRLKALLFCVVWGRAGWKMGAALRVSPSVAENSPPIVGVFKDEVWLSTHAPTFRRTTATKATLLWPGLRIA